VGRDYDLCPLTARVVITSGAGRALEGQPRPVVIQPTSAPEEPETAETTDEPSPPSIAEKPAPRPRRKVKPE